VRATRHVCNRQKQAAKSRSRAFEPEGKSQHKSLGLTIPETLLATADEVIQ